MSGFTDFLGSDKGMNVAGGVSSAIEALNPQQKVNQDFLNRNQNVANQIQNTGRLTDAASTAALQSGNPIAMLVGAGLKSGTALTKSSMDEFGVVGGGFGNKFKQAAGMALNPVEGIRTLIQQDDRESAKDRFINTNVTGKTSQNQEMGNAISNSLPRYQAPSYGRKGLKLRTKFSNNGTVKF